MREREREGQLVGICRTTSYGVIKKMRVDYAMVEWRNNLQAGEEIVETNK